MILINYTYRAQHLAAFNLMSLTVFRIGATDDPDFSVPLLSANWMDSMSAVGIQHSAIRHF